MTATRLVQKALTVLVQKDDKDRGDKKVSLGVLYKIARERTSEPEQN